jgi:SurA-like N-terminal domain
MTRRGIRLRRRPSAPVPVRGRMAGRSVTCVLSIVFLLSFTGCGSMHPGAAAVVGDSTIQESTLDHFTDAVCVSNSVAASQGGQAAGQTATRDLRATILNVLIQSELATQAAAKLGVSVSDGDVQRQLSSGTGLPEHLPPAVEERLTGLISDLVRASLLTNEIGKEQLSGDSTAPVSGKKAAQAGQDYLARFADQIGVDVDPRFGTYSALGVTAGSGSLSVAQSDAAVEGGRAQLSHDWIEQLAASQTC